MFGNGCIQKLNDRSYLCYMSEDLNIVAGTKTEQYQSLIPQVEALLEGETDLIANLANIVAALKEQFKWLWIGFYLVKPAFAKASADKPAAKISSGTSSYAKASADMELVLGPFQGPIACTRIRKGKGVCGTSWATAQTIIVPDVENFPGHIACSSLSRSEIVVPITRNNEVIAVLDVDSEELDHFDETDKVYLEQIVELIEF
jgi:L-methionine (R)-S-oxide reductase